MGALCHRWQSIHLTLATRKAASETEKYHVTALQGERQHACGDLNVLSERNVIFDLVAYLGIFFDKQRFANDPRSHTALRLTSPLHSVSLQSP